MGPGIKRKSLWLAAVRAIYLLSLVAFGTHWNSLAASQTDTNPVYIITLKPGEDSEKFDVKVGLKSLKTFHHAINGFVARIPSDKVASLKKHSRIAAVERDGLVKPAGLACPLQLLPTNYVIFPSGVIRMGLTNFPEYWYCCTNTNNVFPAVNVAVLDTGIAQDSGLLNVYNQAGFVDSNVAGIDWHGHGTAVAGILGAGGSGFGYGIPGVAPGVRLWDVQVMGPTESNWINFLAGMEYVIQHSNEIEVVNASLEGSANNNTGPPEYAIEQAVSNCINAGIVFVAAAGNDGEDVYGPDGIFGTVDDHLPGALPEAMVVSAMDPATDFFPHFSNFSRSVVTNAHVHSPGKAIDVCAPGVDILSIIPGGDACLLSGTSMSCPHVSGLVALYIAAHGRAHNAADVYKIRQAIVDNGLPQSQWASAPNTFDPDGNPEPLAIASTNLIPPVMVSQATVVSNHFQFNFNAEPGFAHTIEYATSVGPHSRWTTLTNPIVYATSLDTSLVGTNFGPTDLSYGYGNFGFYVDSYGYSYSYCVYNALVIDTNQTASKRFYRVTRQPASH